MIKLEMKNYRMMLIEKLQKYQPYHQAKLISMNILQTKKYYLVIKNKIIEQGKFTYFPLGKALKQLKDQRKKTIKDQRKKQVKAIQNQGQIKTIESKKGVDNESHKTFD